MIPAVLSCLAVTAVPPTPGLRLPLSAAAPRGPRYRFSSSRRVRGRLFSRRWTSCLWPPGGEGECVGMGVRECVGGRREDKAGGDGVVS